VPVGLSPSLDAGGAAGDAGAVEALLLGVCWNPVAIGARHPEGLDYSGYAAVDIPLMVELGVNVVRTYEPLLDRAVLDALWASGIRVIDSVYPYGGDDAAVVTERVRQVKDHPAILYYSLGNEWNYNGLYVGLSAQDSLARLNEAARLVKAEDATHPVATIYGELPTRQLVEAMPDIDVWGINAYRGISFGDLFDGWRAVSDKPMFVSEYGADGYDANLPGYAPGSQAVADAALTREILEQATGGAAGARVLGGTLFEWADEWWKDEAGSPSTQEVGGIAPGGGPYPDGVFNEEWWGIVDIQRAPRPAFDSVRSLFGEYRAR
jgi:glycosyl hydrolase family 2